jgi:hypothetical protein
MQRRDQWIKDLCAGKSFVDVGGLWGTVNEKVTVAGKAGAVSTAMLDITPPGEALWGAFQERCDIMGVSGCRCISASIDERDLDSRIGQFDVVHCSGLLYHCPSPIHTLGQLARISREYLILTTAVVPTKVSNSRGTISIPPGGALFIPYLPPREVAILKEHWEASGVSGAIGITTPHSVWQLDDYAPWWWLFPAPTVRQLILAVGFSIVEDCAYWSGHAHSFLARRAQVVPVQRDASEANAEVPYDRPK